ncbi:tRNA N6-adenosine threonylcarbamoyltransferase, mitochondrial isoform X2 [Cylas formicarius]|uniref:tRNA N6-adenosine threonylcarbamoyltransferase, mitochondrial isoform X2 n=1 Tax=Cylas formicarius TaxID=197179 RepID=UPI0029587B4B|nr:tRNA N6-adenosine threonylcarbamoyltransferase, mitochondrial isoform X2 [Cylas formicarius]
MFIINKLRNKSIREIGTFIFMRFCTSRQVILGIETSCDDTGCALVDSTGNLLGEALHSQHLVHLNNGGIIPPIAWNLHRKNIEKTVNVAMENANLTFDKVSAIAVTVKPGLPMSLSVGTKYAKYLCNKYKKPIIPVHHMKAHALTARMFDRSLTFPFLVLLISGGHCLLAIAQSIEDFLLLGESIDDAPGEAFDKMARRLKLKNLPQYSTLSGGAAIEIAASRADDPLQYNFKEPMSQYKDCNFSMAGIKTQFVRHVEKEEADLELAPDSIIPGANNLCAAFLLVMTRHLCHRLQRGIEYISRKGLIPPENQTLVVSGGAACNNFINEGLRIVCEELGYKLLRPPPKLCTDNGVMIAWNGVERWNAKIGVLDKYDDVDVERSSPLGQSLIDDDMTVPEHPGSRFLHAPRHRL